MGVDARMFVRTMEPISDEFLLKLCFRICEAFGRNVMFVLPPEKERGYDPDGRHALTRVQEPWCPKCDDYAYEKNKCDNCGSTPEMKCVWTQDGPPIWPRDGETFIEAHLWGRYYGDGYERGNLPSIVAVAEWLEFNVPGGEVWYGGDSSGCVATRFGPKEREVLKKHFFTHGHIPYTSFFDRMPPLATEKDPGRPTCPLCKVKMQRMGWGANYAAVQCQGCEYRLVSRDNGETWKEEKVDPRTGMPIQPPKSNFGDVAAAVPAEAPAPRIELPEDEPEGNGEPNGS